MCGIAGFYMPKGFAKGDPRSNIEAMLAQIVHRGPDASGVWTDRDNRCLALGHRRLSIIDLTETGSQPMTSHSGRYVISYNGEIYNTKTVLDNMRNAGYADAMHGTSDTEILLEAIAFFGLRKAVSLCKGMFAFAVLDREEYTISLVRDRMGEKPLYYSLIDDGIAFASEPGALRILPGFDDTLNYDCIGDYLKYGYIAAPDSIYRNTYKLRPGCGAIIKCEFNKPASISEFSYWDITDVAREGRTHVFDGSRTEAADRLEELLKNSVRGQMVSDVPLGAFLSGGIDSATVVALMQSQSGVPVRTFTIGFEDADYNEADAASVIARHLGTDHTELYATRQDALDSVPLMPGMFGEPFADSSQIPTFLVSRLTRQHVTVSLSGDGGDELFAGYRDYTGVSNIYSKIHNIPLPLRRVTGSLMEHIPGHAGRADVIRAHGTLLKASDPADLYRRTYETWNGLEKLCGAAVLNGRDGTRKGHTCVYDDFETPFADDPVSTAMLMNMKMYLPDDILVKVDRTAMAVSLETRVPMLDRDVVSFAWTLPMEYLRSGDTGKVVLRDVLYRYVDPELMDRPKHGFGVPVSRWLREGKLNRWADDLLNSDLIKQTEIFDMKCVMAMWDEFCKNAKWRPQIWYVLMLAGWLEENR